MHEINKYLPHGYQWILEKGIVKCTAQKKETVIANAYPQVIGREVIDDRESGKVKKIIKFRYKNCFDEEIGEEQVFEEGDLLKESFIKKRPLEVIVEVSDRVAAQIFREIIQKQANEIQPKKVTVYGFGWNDKKFHWQEMDDRIISKDAEYDAACGIADIICTKNNAVISVILAAVHGPLEDVLISAGIRHDFVTFIVGDTGVGKTSLARKVCQYLSHKPVVFPLSSERKKLRELLQGTKDVTVVVDDFNTSRSDRVISRQLQILSEIVQESCDAGTPILNEDSLHKENRVHKIITSEKVICNLSTMNRCFLVNMDETVPESLWNKICEMEKENKFFLFMQSFIRYVESRYDVIVGKCKTDVSSYKEGLKKKRMFQGTSANRIIETLAVQLTIKKLMIDYLCSVKLDAKKIILVYNIMAACIIECGQELQSEIDDITKNKDHKKYLLKLAEIFYNGNGNGYFLAENEKQYRKYLRKGVQGKPCIGFQVNDGFVSFQPEDMCRLIAAAMGEDSVSVSSLGKELSHYHLAHVDASENKQCCRWHTENKYFHVHFRQLLELTRDDRLITEEVDEDIIEYFEKRMY